MKIMIVIHNLDGGGAERVASLLSLYWESQGNDVLMVLADGSKIVYPYGGRIIDFKYKVHNSSMQKVFNLFRKVTKIMSVIRKENPDHIIGFMPGSNIPLIIAGFLTGRSKSVIVSAHTNPFKLNFAYRLGSKFLYRFPRKVIAVSDGVAHGLREIVFGKKEHIVSIPNPLDINMIDKLSVIDVDVKVRYIVSVGRLEEVKGYDMLIKAFFHLKDKNIHLVILGEGTQREVLVNLIKELNIEDRVHLKGRVDNPFAYMSHAECFILSSRHEGWPMVIMEAMVCRVPVVSFDCDYGPREIIKDGNTGYLVKSGDVDSLTEHIEAVMQSEKGNIIQMLDSAREDMYSFNIGVIARRWLA